MPARTARFWYFQAIFWSIAGTALFLSGTTQMPLFDAFVRNLYFLVAGFLSSFFLAMVIDQLRWLPLLRLRIAAYALAYLVAVFCVVFINAINYTLLGLPLDEIRFGQWMAGALNLGLVYAFWSELFIQQIYLDDPNDRNKPVAAHKLVVEHRGSLIPLAVGDITFLSAAGDYVEIHTADRTYLERNTLHAIEKMLDADTFLRVHRSTIVNTRQVSSATPLGKGRFRLQLESGATVESSRGYRDEVKDRILPGAP